MIVRRSDLSWIMVSDIKKAKKFFTEVLGMHVRADSAEYGWVELMPKDGGCALGIGQYNPGQCGDAVKPGDNAIITFTVDDIVTAQADFAKQNVTMIGDIVEVPGHVKMLFFTDLEGNKFQVVQVLDGSDKKSGCC
jgi:predicted enzyme related to lactoylglutathione lyase